MAQFFAPCARYWKGCAPYNHEMSVEPEFDISALPDFPEMDPTGTVDISQVRCNLELTPAQRICQLQEFLYFVEACRLARIRRHGADLTIAAALEETQ